MQTKAPRGVYHAPVSQTNKQMAIDRRARVGTMTYVANVLRLGIVFLLAAELFAPTGTTSMQGAVLDKSGAAVVGGRVVAENPGQTLERIYPY